MMMHRALCRVIGGACRKFRKNDLNLAGEDVRQNSNKSKEEVAPPTHSFSEALGWTTGIILTYEFTHRRRGQGLLEDYSSISPVRSLQGYLQKCPFAVATKAVAQPILTSISAVNSVQIQSIEKQHLHPLTSRKSIDITPFLIEKRGNESYFKDSKYADHINADYDNESEDEGVYFDESLSKFDEVRSSRPRDLIVVNLAEKITSDLFSAFGVFKYLAAESSRNGKSGVGSAYTPRNALDLLENGAELGSSRALYNIGVAYDRKNDPILAGEYYKRASDLGHPLASYNVAVLNLKSGLISEGLSLMHFAAENGVPEARRIIGGV